MKFGIHTILMMCCVLFFACSGSNTKGEKPIVCAYNECLYPADLLPLFDENTDYDEADSLQIIQSFTRQWLVSRVLSQKAEENLVAEEKDVEALINDYRKSLLIYRYQQKIVSERIDTFVSEDEMKYYFNSHPDDFSLIQPIVRINYIKIKSDSRELNKIKSLLKSNTAVDKTRLFQFCVTHAEKQFLDEEAWLLLDEVRKEIPIETYNDEHFLKNNKFVEINENDVVYLLRIFDYRIQNGPSEYAFEKEKIRSIIIQQRKNAFLKKLEEDLVKDAEAEGKLNYHH
jgi:hypothetical protein